MRGAPQKGFAKLISRISCRTSRATLSLPGRRRDFQRQKERNPARCHRRIVSGRTIVTAPRTVGASRYSKTRIKRSKDVRAGRLGALRRSTFNWCRSAITSPWSELLDRKRSRKNHLSRLKISSTRRSSPDSGVQAKWMAFAVDGILGLARSAGFWWLRFRLMIERGPPERPQASEEKRSHGTLCRIGCVGERDQRVYR
jgi:hypothetical protein